MAPEDDIKKRVARKLAKPRKEEHRATMEIPEQFRDGDDADEDYTALHGMTSYVNQSVFGMIAAAGSQADFKARFDGLSSDEDEDEVAESAPTLSSLSTGKSTKDKASGNLEKKHKRKISGHSLLKSLPRLVPKPKSKGLDKRSSSPVPESPSDPDSPTTQIRDAPMMSRMLEAKAELALRPSFEMQRTEEDNQFSQDGEDPSTDRLARTVMEIFKLETPEKVIEEYPCWLMKSVLLQGYMYITEKHVSFYAYLPKKSNEVIKSGYLAKSGRRNPKYNRYWFRLKGDVLSYHNEPSDLYFPRGNIDLRYGISANVVENVKGKDATYFTLETAQRKFNFRADSIPSAKEWVKALQKIIFRSHNDGDSVKISFPTENIMDVEDNQIVEFANTCKIRVIDNDETYAIDEYFFSFFGFGEEAVNVLKVLVEDNAAQQIQDDHLTPGEHNKSTIPSANTSKRHSQASTHEKSSIPPLRTETPILKDALRETLPPIQSPRSPTSSSPRASAEMSRSSFDVFRRSTDRRRFSGRSMDSGNLNMDGTRRRSASVNRRSLSRHRQEDQKRCSEKQGSSDSYVQSLGDPASSGALLSASEETQASASQILKGSDVFFSPTIQRSQSNRRNRDQETVLGDSSRSGSPSGKPRNKDDTLIPAVGHRPADSHSDISPSVPTLQNIVKAGVYPLQQAAGLAGYLNKHSKRMSSLLATESMGYVEKVSGMWKGGKKHYDENTGASGGDEDYDDGEDNTAPGERFREHFALPATEKLQAAYFGYLHRVLPLYGKIYLSDRSFCFRSLLPGTRTKLILPLKDIENVDKEKGFRFGYSGLVVVIKGHEELFFEFRHAELRDDCAVSLLQNLEAMRYLQESGLLTLQESESAENARAEHKALQQLRKGTQDDHDLNMSNSMEDSQTDAQPIIFDDPRASILNFKPTEPLRITCLTIGSRGDVQPYIALCKGLIAEGHIPKIATHLEFKDWIEGHGIAFAEVDGDPAELMRICIENGMFTVAFLREAASKFRGWIDMLLSSAWKACQGSDILIESPSAMGGIHIAEALGIPYFRAFSMPWTRTRAYPHAFAVPEHKLGGAYNYVTYVMFDSVFWKGIAGQVNRWRKKELNLQATTLEKMQPNKVPFLYNFSPSVVVPPLDFSDWIRVTGYWFLDEGTEWEPPKEMTDFIKKAQDDKKKLVYVGFGSIIVDDSAALTTTIIKSVQKADVRCILSKGWSDRLDKKGENIVEVKLPPEILQIKSAPHDWLFSQMDAVVHHGGAGTTGASLRAGIPTIIKPFFGDQYFFGSRVEDLGVGIYMRKLNLSVFARALWEATHSERMITKARYLGQRIRSENGVDSAIQAIYRDMEYARSLIKVRKETAEDDSLEEEEESWTFIGDESESEIIRRIYDQQSVMQMVAERENALATGLDEVGVKGLGHLDINY